MEVGPIFTARLEGVFPDLVMATGSTRPLDWFDVLEDFALTGAREFSTREQSPATIARPFASRLTCQAAAPAAAVSPRVCGSRGGWTAIVKLTRVKFVARELGMMMQSTAM
jgi:hypothetical protein